MEQLNTCLACGNELIFELLNLGNQPLANSYLEDRNMPEDDYPLRLNHCPECNHLQLSHAVDPSVLFKHYVYVSGTTKTLRDYFDSFVDIVQEYTSGNRVLDIACNDGSQLDSFKAKGYQTYGIDPAENLYSLSSANHTVVCDFLNARALEKLNSQFDVIVAQNVLAHNDYPAEFLLLCKQSLAPGGRIFIQTSQADMVENLEFDTIYHEHLSFFCVESFCALARRVGLKVIDIRRTPIHGTSFVFVLSNDESDSDRSDEFIQREQPRTMYMLRKYAENAEHFINNIKSTLRQYKLAGFTLVGYGAAAKGNTILNYGQIELDWIVDDNPLKQGLFTPGMRIPIKPSSSLVNQEKLLVIPLAWNFYAEIKKRVLAVNPHVRFLAWTKAGIFVEVG